MLSLAHPICQGRLASYAGNTPTDRRIIGRQTEVAPDSDKPANTGPGANLEGIQFEEMSRSVDVNAEGALFLLKQDQERHALRLSLPLPRSMQKTAASKPVYETEAVVVRIQADELRQSLTIHEESFRSNCAEPLPEPLVWGSFSAGVAQTSPLLRCLDKLDVILNFNCLLKLLLV